MSDSYVQLPPNSTGTKLDTEQLTVGSNTVERERNQLAGVGADDIAVVTDGEPTGSDHGVVTREAPPQSPVITVATETDLAAGSSAALDSDQLSAGKTGKLWRVDVSSSVPIKVVVKKVADGVETVIGTRYGWQGHVTFHPPHRDFAKVTYSASAGLDGFRVTVTNLVPGSAAADVTAVFYVDETG